MSDLSNITVNGVPLKVYVDEEIRSEVETHCNRVVGTAAKTIKAHPVTSTIRNHSGSRSGKCKIIFSAALGGWQ